MGGGNTFTLADVVLGLSVNRWKMTPLDRPDVPAIDAWFEQLNQRPAFYATEITGCSNPGAIPEILALVPALIAWQSARKEHALQMNAE